ncbi:paramyosin-like [Crassostrea angulata]|uniref:paramyosin-like n=1 Tax=Magallana angulata TaxID=2784310 RepID=UPI0022B1FD8B|nr:paramyosin-like [Crassostrea angulata]
MKLVIILAICVGFIWTKADSSRLTDNNNKATTLQENKTPDCYETSFLRQMINQETVIRLALVKNVHALVNDISILKESFAASETKISELQRTVDALNIQVNSLQQENGQLKKSSLISQAKSMELETKFQNVSDNVSALHGQLNVIQKESDDKRQEVFNKTNAVLDDIKIEVRYLSVTLLDFKERTEIENESRDKKYSELERHSNTSIESLKVKNSLTKEFGKLKSFVQNLQDSQTEITENINRTVARFDVQFTLSEHTQHNFSSALASLETAQTKLSKSIDDKNNHHAFTAGISSSNYSWTGSTLVFPTVIYSEGTGYKPSTGIFTAPSAGTYVFYVSVQTAHRKSIYLDIVLNGSRKVRAMTWYDSGSSVDIHLTGTNLVILHLQTGDRVWVRRYIGTGYYSSHVPSTTFSGFKLN